MPPKPQIIATRTLAQTRIFHIEGVDLRFANGAEASYERLVGPEPGAVLVIPMMDDDTVLLVREYAAGEERYELGLPKGRIEPGEDPLQAGNRELKEEVGYGARRLIPLTTLSLSPAYVKHSTHLVLACDLYPDRLQGDEPEPIEVVPWRLADLSTLVQRPDCTEARTIAALFLARDYFAHGRQSA